MAGAVSNLMVRAGFDGSQLTQGLNQMQGQLRGTQSVMSESFGRIKDILTALGIEKVFEKITDGVKEAFKTGIEYNAMLEQQTTAWTTLLGSQQKAKQMMLDIANFAKSTPFQTQDINMMAVYLNNADIKGQALFDQLGKISDVSSAFAIPAEDAKTMVMEMGHVLQAHQAYAMELNELENKGVPIYQAIAKELGTTVAGVKKLSSEGKISSDIYMKAFNNIANSVKGASKSQSETFNGLMTTLKDDYLMIMGVLEKPIFNVLKKGLDTVMPLLNGLSDWATKGDFKGFRDALDSTLGKGATTTIMVFASNLQQIGTTLTVVKTNIMNFVNNVRTYFDSLLSGKSNIGTSFISIFNTIKSIAMPILNDIVNFIRQEFAQIKAWWDVYGGQITEAVKNFFAVLAAIFRFLAPILLFIIKSVWDNIKGVIDGAIKIIEGIILVFTGLFTLNWKTLWQGIKDILGGALEIIWNAIQLLFIGKLLKGIGSFFGLLKGLFSGGWSEITSGLRLFVDDAGTWFAKFLDTAKSKFSDIVDAAKNIPSGIVQGLKSGVHAIEDAIGGLATTLVDKFKSVLGIHSPSRVFAEMGGHILSGLVNGLTNGNLMDLGKMVFKDFGGGIMNTVDKIKGFLTGAFSGGASGNVAGWLQSALAITGAPSSWLGALSTLVQHESGGNPNAINLWDSNAKAGHPSKGLFQTIDSTFASYAIKGLGDIYNPVANAVAGIRYIMARYGDITNVPGIASMMNGGAYKGYASGTNSATAGWHWVGENGPELMRFNGGEQVKTNRQSMEMLNQKPGNTYNLKVINNQSMNENDLQGMFSRMEALNNYA